MLALVIDHFTLFVTTESLSISFLTINNKLAQYYFQIQFPKMFIKWVICFSYIIFLPSLSYFKLTLSFPMELDSFAHSTRYCHWFWQTILQRRLNSSWQRRKGEDECVHLPPHRARFSREIAETISRPKSHYSNIFIASIERMLPKQFL